MHYDEFDEEKLILVGPRDPLASAANWYTNNIERPYFHSDALDRYGAWLYSQGIVVKHTEIPGHGSRPIAYYKDEQSQALFLLRWS